MAIREMEGVVHFRLVSDQDRRSNDDFDDKGDQEPSAPVRSAPSHIARKLALARLSKYMKHMRPEEKPVARAALAQGHGPWIKGENAGNGTALESNAHLQALTPPDGR